MKREIYCRGRRSVEGERVYIGGAVKGGGRMKRKKKKRDRASVKRAKSEERVDSG